MATSSFRPVIGFLKGVGVTVTAKVEGCGSVALEGNIPADSAGL
jgi:hypothetical protein